MKRYTRFINEALNLRDEFEDFRQKYLGYQRTISNPDNIPLKELCEAYEDAVNDVNRQIHLLSPHEKNTNLIYDLWDSVCEVKSGGEIGDPNTTIGLNLGSILSKGIKGVEIHKIKARARMIFDLWHKLMQIKNYGELITRTFKIDPNEIERDIELTLKIAIKSEKLAEIKRHEIWDIGM